MSGRQSELESRLDDALSRIAMETQEIKELERQLTNGQVMVNETLQSDLEQIIFGLQEYLRGLREQEAGLQQLQDVQRERDALRQQSDGHQRILKRLNRKLRKLNRSMCDSDQLDHLVELLHTHTHQAASLGSLGTQDSGLGLQCLSPPEARRQQDRRPAGGGHRVYTHPDAAAAERSDRRCTPPLPPPSSHHHHHARLFCNIPEHLQGDRCVCECVHKEAERLEEKKLHTLRRQHSSVMQVCDEVECVEKTLLKRRAELRQADRLLLQAESCRRQELRSQSREETRVIAHRAELRLLLQELLVEQQALEGVKNKRTRRLQRLHKTQEELDRTREELDGTREELVQKREELDRTREELDGTREELDGTREELDRTREELDGTREELDGTREELDGTREELDGMREELDGTREELDGMREELDRTREELDGTREERSRLQEQCRNMEARRKHADRLVCAAVCGTRK